MVGDEAGESQEREAPCGAADGGRCPGDPTRVRRVT